MMEHYERVKDLCRQIHERNAYRSSFATDDPAYAELVALGPEAVPALLRRVADFKAHAEVTGTHYDEMAIWEPLIALHAITGRDSQDGVKQEGGFMKAHLPTIMDSWLDWGREEGIEWDE